MVPRRNPRGFTLVELIVVVAITTLGFMSVMNLQIGTLHGTGAARDMQHGLELAEYIGQSMRLEALQWTPTLGHPTNVVDAIFLDDAPLTTTAGTQSAWIIAYDDGLGTETDLRLAPVGAHDTYDAGIGPAIGYDPDAVDPVFLNRNFCVHYRLTWIVPNTLLRADIRVMWARARGQFDAYALCPTDATTAMWTRLEDLTTITMPVTVMQNMFVITP